MIYSAMSIATIINSQNIAVKVVIQVVVEINRIQNTT